MPAGLQFAMPATFERTVDVTTLGFDFEAVGYPAISLALRDPDAKWSWLGGQTFRVGGLDGLGPENELVQAGQLTRTGDVFGFGGQLFVQLVWYPESGASLLIGQATPIVVKVTAPNLKDPMPGSARRCHLPPCTGDRGVQHGTVSAAAAGSRRPSCR